jgi:hypothetical protein
MLFMGSKTDTTTRNAMSHPDFPAVELPTGGLFRTLPNKNTMRPLAIGSNSPT